MLYLPAPQLVRLQYWRDAGPMPAYERAVTAPLDVLLNRLPLDGWDDLLGPPEYYAWTRRLDRGIEHFQIVPLVPSETSQFLLQ